MFTYFYEWYVISIIKQKMLLVLAKKIHFVKFVALIPKCL